MDELMKAIKLVEEQLNTNRGKSFDSLQRDDHDNNHFCLTSED